MAITFANFNRLGRLKAQDDRALMAVQNMEKQFRTHKFYIAKIEKKRFRDLAKNTHLDP